MMSPFIIFFSFISLFHASTSVQTCRLSRCSSAGPSLRFPFRISESQPTRCSYPGFDLSCNNEKETIIALQGSGNFSVKRIDYDDQTLWINDPANCLPKRFLNFTFPSSTFRVIDSGLNLTFLNCTVDMTATVPEIMPIPCLSGENYTVTALPEIFSNESSSWPCRVIKTAFVPAPWEVVWSGMNKDFGLRWSDPGCGPCEAGGGICGFKSGSGLEIGCSFRRRHDTGLPRTAKYGIIVGAGVPGLLSIIAMSCYICGKVRMYGIRRRHQNGTEFATSIAPQIVVTMGLDEPKIESYPKTLLGASRRLPNPNDNTCPICLSDYQPKEELRTIPECNHYFHVSCIDEWLRLNATCPLCRNSPDSSSSAGTDYSSSTFSVSSSSSSST